MHATSTSALLGRLFVRSFRYARSAPLIILLLTAALAAGCGKQAPEKVMIGQWEVDKEATKKTNPFVAANPKKHWYEFKSDGSYAHGLMDGIFKGTWKQSKKEGSTLILEIVETDDKEPKTVEIAVVGKDHITLNYPEGLGIIHLKRTTSDVTATGDASTKEKGSTAGATIGPRDSIETGWERMGEVAMTPDASLATVVFGARGEKRKFQVWDLRKKQKIAGFESNNKLLSMAPDGKTIACESLHGSAQILDATTGKELKRATGLGSNNFISPKQDMIVMKANGMIIIYDWTTEKVILKWETDEEEYSQISIAVLWEGEKKIISGHKNGEIKIWDFASGKLVQTLSGGHEKGNMPVDVAVSPNGKRLASTKDFKVKIWDLPAGKVVKTIDKGPDVMWFLPDGKTLVYDDLENIVLENLETGSQRTIPANLGGMPKLNLTSDGKVLVTVGKDGILRIWDIQAP